MKKNQLALAILTAAALLSACDDQKKPAEKGAATEQAAENKAAPVAQNAEQIEARYKEDAAQANALYEKFYASGPNANLFRKYDYSVSDYQKNEQGATAKASLTLDLNPAVYGENVQPVILNFTDTITYNKELLDKGIVAQVEHKIDNPEAIKTFIDNFASLAEQKTAGEETADGKTGEEKPAEEKPGDKATAAGGGINTVFEHLQLRTDLLTDDNAVASATITPFQYQEGDDSIDFKGLNYNVRYNNKTLAEGIYGLDFALEPLTFTATDKEDGDSATVSIAPVKGAMDIKEDGTFSLKVDPIKTETTNTHGLSTFEIAGIDGKGEGLKFDSALGSYLGNVDINANGIRVSRNNEAINLGDINIKADTKKSAAGNYDTAGTFVFKLDGASLKQAIPMLSVEPQSLRLHVGLNELSAAANTSLTEGLQLLNPHFAAGNTELPPEAVDKFQVAANEIIKNKTRFNTEIEAQTDSGKAQLTANVGIRSDSPVTAEEWQKAIDGVQENPLPLQDLLKNNLDLHAELRVSKSLVDKLGFSEMVEQQGAMFVTLEGDEYRVKIEGKEGKIELNGNPLPF